MLKSIAELISGQKFCRAFLMACLMANHNFSIGFKSGEYLCLCTYCQIFQLSFLLLIFSIVIFFSSTTFKTRSLRSSLWHHSTLSYELTDSRIERLLQGKVYTDRPFCESAFLLSSTCFAKDVSCLLIC